MSFIEHLKSGKDFYIKVSSEEIAKKALDIFAESKLGNEFLLSRTSLINLTHLVFIKSYTTGLMNAFMIYNNAIQVDDGFFYDFEAEYFPYSKNGDEKTKKVYSLNEENDYTDDLHQCIIDGASDSNEFPFELTVYEGTEEEITPEMLLPDLYDKIEDNIGEVTGEWSNGWIYNIKEKQEKLQKDFCGWFERWMKENDCEIDFWNVDNIKETKYLVRSEDDYEEIKEGK